MDEETWAELRNQGFRPVQKTVNMLTIMKQQRKVIVNAMSVKKIDDATSDDGDETNKIPLTPAKLAATPAHEQKMMIRDHLLPEVKKINLTLAEQVVDQMMNSENEELLSLLSSTAQLKAKVGEVTQVLTGGSESSTPGVAAAVVGAWLVRS